jgi:hypothetical protein
MNGNVVSLSELDVSFLAYSIGKAATEFLENAVVRTYGYLAAPFSFKKVLL